MKKRARYTNFNFLLLLLKNYTNDKKICGLLCVEGRTEPKKCGKSKLKAASNDIYFVVCCTLTFPYPQ